MHIFCPIKLFKASIYLTKFQNIINFILSKCQRHHLDGLELLNVKFLHHKNESEEFLFIWKRWEGGGGPMLIYFLISS